MNDLNSALQEALAKAKAKDSGIEVSATGQVNSGSDVITPDTVVPPTTVQGQTATANQAEFRNYEPVSHFERIAGVHVLFGAAGAGKSKAISDLIEKVTATYPDTELTVVYASEPDFRSIGDTKMAVAMLNEFEGREAVVVVDSLKDLLYTNGALTTGGVSLTGLSILSTLSSRFSQLGSICFVVLNPLQDDLSERIFEMIKGSVAGAWYVKNNTIERGAYRYWNGSYYDRLEAKSVSDMLDGVVKDDARATSYPGERGLGVAGNFDLYSAHLAVASYLNN